ncbi:MAG: diguanylate cyclase [Ilumatobacteraceae bacterium]|nr:diguanylate cyclase [Ilumatobacteraceae bacterium]
MGGTESADSAASRLHVDASAVLNAVPGVVAVVGAEGDVVWINESMTQVTGFSVDDLVGSNMLDHLDLEWNALSLESISYALDNPGMRLPTMLRFHTKYGSPVVMEVTANNQLDDPQIRGLVVHMRPSDERQLVELILESFMAGDDLASTIGRVHDVANAETLRAESAVFLLFPGTDDHRPVLASSPEVGALSAMAGLSTPWSVAASSGQPVVLADLTELPAPVRAAAEAAGFAACWCYPVCRTVTGVVDAVLVLWRRETGSPEPTATMLAERLAKLCALVLERVEHGRDLQHAADHDGLTGLVNRARFFDAVDGHIARGAAPLGVIYLDLDGFKPINDHWGHGHGDQVLIAVADRLRASVRPGDTVARLGGDEFAVACPGATSDELIRLADRLLAVVRAPITVADSVLRVGASIGLATCAAGAGPGDVLVAAADAALLAAKSTAKGTWNLSPALP